MVGIKRCTGLWNFLQTYFLRGFEMKVVEVGEGTAVAHLGCIIRYRASGRKAVEDFNGVIIDNDFLLAMA